MSTPVRRPVALVGVVTLAVALLLALVPAVAQAVEGSRGNPGNECAGLVYLDKFDFTTNSFAVGDTSVDGDTYTSSTGVTVTFTTEGGEATEVSWTSTEPIDRVWLKAGRATDRASTYDEATEGTETVSGNAFSHLTFCYDEAQPEEPGFTVLSECVEGASRITIQVENPDDVAYELTVVIEDTAQAVTSTTSFIQPAGTNLQVTDGEGTVLADTDFGSCTTDPEPVPTTATLAVDTACVENIPTLTYTVDITRGDDQVESVVVTVVDADEAVVDTVTVLDDATGAMSLPDRDGDVFLVTWDFDDTALSVTLPDDCSEVQGVTEEPEPEPTPEATPDPSPTPEATPEPGTTPEAAPEPLPEPQVLGEQVTNPAPDVEGDALPNAGSQTTGLLIMSLLLVWAGGILLAIGRREQVA